MLWNHSLACVLKSNAYGHGLEEVYRALAPLKPEILCLNYLYEAKLIRELGYRGRLILVGPSFAYELEDAYKLKVEITIGCESLFLAWLESSNKCLVHLEFDTGLSRQGLYVHKSLLYLEKIKAYKVFLRGITTHFSDVEDVTKQHYAQKQLDRFLQVDKTFCALGVNYERHAAASAPALILKEARFDLCRIGISLYGFWPSDLTRLSYLSQNKVLLPLKPVLTWKTKVASVREIKSGSFVGYGCSYRASSDLKIATLPVGYHEGYPRTLSNSGAYVLCGGVRCSLLGRVCMNMIIVDVSQCSDIYVGDEVTLLGEEGSEVIKAEDLALWANTIQYEIVTRIHPRVERCLLS